MILHNFATMPLAPTRNLYLWSPSQEECEESEAPKEHETTQARDSNVLLERQYLKTYWHYFRVSLGVQGILATCVLYGGVTIATHTFSGTVMRSFCGAGLILHMYSMYLKRVKMDDLQNQIEPLYKKQVDAYERFLSDSYEGYD